MPRDDTFHLRYMLEAAQISLYFAEGRTRGSLDDDLLFFYALGKAVETIGEAASHLTENFKTQHPSEVNEKPGQRDAGPASSFLGFLRG